MKKIMMALAPLLILTACTNQAGLGKLGKYQLNKPNKEFNKYIQQSVADGYLNSLRGFSTDFMQTIDSYYKDDDNHVFSPMSIATCFSMALDGAKGETRNQLEKLLHYDESFKHLFEIQNALLKTAIDDPQNKTFLDVSQSAWFNDDHKDFISDEYIKTLEEYYFAECYQGNLSNMSQEIADWVNAKTKNFLNANKDEFQVDGLTALMLLNTVYLNSPWSREFKESDNLKDTFHSAKSGEQTVTYMRNSIAETYYYRGEGYKIAYLPMKHGLTFRMLLPDENVTYPGALTDEEALNKLLSVSFVSEGKRANINYRVPQFKTRDEFNLTNLFKSMGCNLPFLDSADFTGMLKPDAPFGLFISDAKHVACFEAKNKGIEAAAYTVIVESCTSVGPSEPVETIDFYCDRPFAYAVTSQEGLPLFMGKVTHF